MSEVRFLMGTQNFFIVPRSRQDDEIYLSLHGECSEIVLTRLNTLCNQMLGEILTANWFLLDG